MSKLIITVAQKTIFDWPFPAKPAYLGTPLDATAVADALKTLAADKKTQWGKLTFTPTDDDGKPLTATLITPLRTSIAAGVPPPEKPRLPAADRTAKARETLAAINAAKKAAAPANAASGVQSPASSHE
jgi:hypothetical protein